MDVLNGIKSTIYQVTSDITSIKDKLNTVDDAIDLLCVETKDLHNQTEQMEIQLNRLDQAALSSSFNIFGLPNIKNDLVLPILMEIGKVSGISILQDDLKTAFSITSKDKQSSQIFGTFYDERKKQR